MCTTVLVNSQTGFKVVVWSFQTDSFVGVLVVISGFHYLPSLQAGCMCLKTSVISYFA